MWLISFIIAVCLSVVVESCQRLDVSSVLLNLHHNSFRALTAEESLNAGFRSGRGAYVSEDLDTPLYLYHTVADPHGFGVGRWVVYDSPGPNTVAHAYVDSWAVMPHLVHAINDPEKSSWNVYVGNEWKSDNDFVVKCTTLKNVDPLIPSDDNTIYLEVHGFPWHMSGFYVQIGDSNEMPVYSHVHADGDTQLYLYKKESTWVIGEEIGSDRGLAYVVDSSSIPGRITHPNWYYSRNNVWEEHRTAIVHATRKLNLYARLKEYRSIPYLPPGQTYHRLRHDIPMPSIGLGTGNIPIEEMKSTINTAMQLGYRMFDMAREYGNEGIMGEILSHSGDGVIPVRHEIYLVSKVWPTELGFTTTSSAISQSLQDMETAYVDLYMLHWPWCVQEWPWMHCETTVDPAGTWVQSYKSLERAYAEGRVASIGVSNFNVGLLQDVKSAAVVSPHVVQNHATLSNMDMDVRQWCSDNGAAYMPYSSQREIHVLPKSTQKVIRETAKAHKANQHAVVTRFFLQTGAVVIPRSTKPVHLKENIELVQSFTLSEDEMGALGWPYSPWHSEL